MENPVNSRLGLTIKGNEVTRDPVAQPAPCETSLACLPQCLILTAECLVTPGAKPTSLWGLMNPDMPTARIESAASEGDLNQVGGRTLEAMNLRSVTPEGFAYAFFMANNRLDNLTGDAVGRSEWQKQFLSQMFPGGISQQCAELLIGAYRLVRLPNTCRVLLPMSMTQITSLLQKQ